MLNDGKPEDAEVVLRGFPTTDGAPNIPQLLFETEESKRKKRKRSATEIESDGCSLMQEMKNNYVGGQVLRFDVPNVFPEGEVRLVDYEEYLKQCRDSFKAIDNCVVKNAFFCGKRLSRAFDKFQEEKAKRRVSGSFDDWVNLRCQIDKRVRDNLEYFTSFSHLTKKC